MCFLTGLGMQPRTFPHSVACLRCGPHHQLYSWLHIQKVVLPKLSSCWSSASGNDITQSSWCLVLPAPLSRWVLTSFPLIKAYGREGVGGRGISIIHLHGPDWSMRCCRLPVWKQTPQEMTRNRMPQNIPQNHCLKNMNGHPPFS